MTKEKDLLRIVDIAALTTLNSEFVPGITISDMLETGIDPTHQGLLISCINYHYNRELGVQWEKEQNLTKEKTNSAMTLSLYTRLRNWLASILLGQKNTTTGIGKKDCTGDEFFERYAHTHGNGGAEKSTTPKTDSIISRPLPGVH
jgi:hypothetical protein|tara:strand:- start:1588 stop:2025 length:438 start_codon:yes stop_codon:yes gene_type:complete